MNVLYHKEKMKTQKENYIEYGVFGALVLMACLSECVMKNLFSIKKNSQKIDPSSI